MADYASNSAGEADEEFYNGSDTFTLSLKACDLRKSQRTK